MLSSATTAGVSRKRNTRALAAAEIATPVAFGFAVGTLGDALEAALVLARREGGDRLDVFRSLR